MALLTSHLHGTEDRGRWICRDRIATHNVGVGYGLRRRHSLMRGMRRSPRRKEMAMGLKRLVGLMGLIGLVGVVVVSVCFSVAVWVV